MYLFLQSLAKLFFRIKYKIYFHNKEKLPPPTESLKGGFIIACNHQYYWDPPIVAAFVKGKHSFMAKASLFESNKLFAKLITSLGAFPVVRGAQSEQALERAFEDLKKGRIFVIFPEGTRSKDGTLGKGKSGVALIASRANVPVLPVCLMYRLNGQKRRLDYAIGDMIPASELRIENMTDRRELKKVSEKVMGAIAHLQEQIRGE